MLCIFYNDKSLQTPNSTYKQYKFRASWINMQSLNQSNGPSSINSNDFSPSIVIIPRHVKHNLSKDVSRASLISEHE